MRSLGVPLPRPAAVARHAGPRLLEATIIPLVLFYVALACAGLWVGIASALAWQYAAVGRRWLAGRDVPAILVLGVLGMTARTALAIATHSAFLYFLQPTLGTVVVALAFLVSVPMGRPLAGRLALDFCPLPDELLARRSMRRFFAHISLLWGAVYLVNAGVVLFLLLTQPIATYVLASKLVSLAMTTTTIGVSVLWFKLAVVGRRTGRDTRPVTVAPAPAPSPVAALAAA